MEPAKKKPPLGDVHKAEELGRLGRENQSHSSEKSDVKDVRLWVTVKQGFDKIPGNTSPRI
jgi:hypothetical protein